MEINVIDVKCFCGKPSFVDKQMNEKKTKNKKNKFGELSTKEIQEITDNALSVTTKKP